MEALVPIDVGNALSLTDRSQPWSRWCSRSIRGVDLNSNRLEATPRLHTQENPLDNEDTAHALRQFFAIPEDFYEVALETRPYWQSNITYWDSTMLGQVIFPTPVSKTEGFQPRLQKTRREFVTQVPGLVSSLESIGKNDPTTKVWNEEFVLIRLTPSSKNALPVPLELAPDLEIRIAFDENSKTASIHDVRLVRRNELDVLLPQNTMDTRFVRRTCVYSRKSALDPSITRFIQSSNLDIWGTGRLKTPTNLHLLIPPHSIGPTSDGSNIRRLRQFKHHHVEYTFASLDHRTEIRIPFRQQPGERADLTYTSIEAGKIGGRRDELCIQQPTKPKKIYEVDFEDVSDHHYKEDGDHVDATVNDGDDEHHSASLLRKANALIYSIENPILQNGAERKGYGVGKAQARINKARAREEEVRMAERARAKAKVGTEMRVGGRLRKVPTTKVRRTEG